MIVWTDNLVTNSFCLAIFYSSGIWSSASTIPSSIPFPTSTLYSFRDKTFSWTIHVLASDVNVVSPRGPRVYLSVIRMEKSHSWSTSLNQYFPSTQRHLYSHPFTVWRLMESKYISGIGDWRNLMVWGLGLLSWVCYSYVNIMTWSYFYTSGECSSYHSTNVVTPLLTTSNVHDRETSIII